MVAILILIFESLNNDDLFILDTLNLNVSYLKHKMMISRQHLGSALFPRMRLKSQKFCLRLSTHPVIVDDEGDNNEDEDYSVVDNDDDEDADADTFSQALWVLR